MTDAKKLTPLEKIDAKIEKMRKQRAVILTRETNEQRKLRSRKCAILGAWLMANDPDAVAKIVSQLKRPQDIAVFADQRQEATPSPGQVTDTAPGEPTP